MQIKLLTAAVCRYMRSVNCNVRYGLWQRHHSLWKIAFFAAGSQRLTFEVWMYAAWLAYPSNS